MFGRKPSFYEIGAIIVTVLLSFALDWALALPRMLLLILVLGPKHVPESGIAVVFFLLSGFLCAIVEGAAGIAASRRFFRQSRTELVAVYSAVLALAYAVLTIPVFSVESSIVSIFVDRLPVFCPVYLELCGSLPGWLLGYFFASGYDAQNEISGLTKLTLAGLAAVIVAAIYVSPPYVPSGIARVPVSFHAVP